MARRIRNALVLMLGVLLNGCIAGTPDVRFAASSPLSPLPAPSQAPRPSPTTGPLTLTLIHSNDTWGYVDPCG